MNYDQIKPMNNGRNVVKVLWLEDEVVARDIIKSFIEATEWNGRLDVEWVEDGDEAWRRLTARQPDIFITDLAHPGLGGEQLLTMIAAEKMKFPILVMTGCAVSDGLKNIFFDLNVTLMTKPFRPEDLHSALTSLYQTVTG
jgi:two-component system response regulator YesN